VIADEVHPTRRARAERRRGAKASLEFGDDPSSQLGTHRITVAGRRRGGWK
jgi:hypothetical protein